MKNIIFLFVLSLLVNFSDSKRFKKSTISNKKNNTYRTFLIKTELNKTEIENLFKNNDSLIQNNTIISEINDENEATTEEIDIEIEDEINDNGTMPYIIDFLDKKIKTSEEQSFLSINNQNYFQKSKFRKFLPLISLLFFIFALIYFNALKNNKKTLKIYKFFELDLKEEKLIVKNE